VEGRAPSLDLEMALWRRQLVRVAGVDEAGIGSLCGPVVAAAVILAPFEPAIPGVRDSKTLSPAQRVALDREIRARAVAVGVGAASVAEIERLNIRRASHLAMRRALARVGPYDYALIDGLPIGAQDLGPCTTVIDGDARCYSIACASIVAKVLRDRLLARLARRYPAYGWDRNAGYGTPEHLTALVRYGLTPYHRQCFRPVRTALARWAAVGGADR